MKNWNWKESEIFFRADAVGNEKKTHKAFSTFITWRDIRADRTNDQVLTFTATDGANVMSFIDISDVYTLILAYRV